MRKIPHPGPRFESLITQVEATLAGPLPGATAHRHMWPRPLDGPPPKRPARGRPAAGLILLYPGDSGPGILLTVRSSELPTHKGQVSLPGGAQEPGETLWETAVRETREEIGVNPAGIRRLGSLSPVSIPSGFLLHPFVGEIQERPEFKIDETEVARLLEVPLSELKDPEILRMERRVLRQGECDVPYFLVEGEKIWGATAMVLAEFLWILGGGERPALG